MFIFAVSMIQIILHYSVNDPLSFVYVDALQSVSYTMQMVTIGERENLDQWLMNFRNSIIEEHKNNPEPQILLDIRRQGVWGAHNAIDNTGTISTEFAFVVVPYEREPDGGSWHKMDRLEMGLFQKNIKVLSI
jgi:hypothetical protein